MNLAVDSAPLDRNHNRRPPFFNATASPAAERRRARFHRAPPQKPPSKAPEFRVLFEREHSYVYASLLRLGVSAIDVEDLVHEVFITVHRRIDDYETDRPLRPWLFGIALRVAMRYRGMARHRREVIHDRIEVVDNRPAADEQLMAGQARAMVAEALQSLDIDRRAVFVMSEIDEMAMPEIAEALGIPLNTAYSRLRRARALFTAAVMRIRCRQEFGTC